uniref:Uncharacterized protein n=1 Tax=Myoviridae sp. ctgXL3 TaxID=2826681 RepID=A0A8S5QS63_9CAUD|nr:MAG TPA: hypothetical protein [Myoviridae sp. ctgXL3]
MVFLIIYAHTYTRVFSVFCAMCPVFVSVFVHLY